jgi:asparagine synthase (glutamine-hydrolysing)
MCGIAGIIYKDHPVDAHHSIKKMTELVAHRGPDGSGYWHSNKIYFGHQRLAIVDLSDAGVQPMEYDGYVITYNGEVYNYLELKAELEIKGYFFQSHSDTEVILAAYKCWGAGCLNRFNGMWSFAIYDPYKKIVFCSRDRFGVKPFYYLDQPEKFVFGSEIKQLLHFIDKPKVRQQSLIHYLAFNLVDTSEDSFFEGIKNLPGSHYLEYDLLTNTSKISRYYSISIHPEVAQLTYPEALERFQQHFERSITWRLRSDVRVGTCLSGGLDSSFIALVASKANTSSAPFCAFTAASVDENWNEEAYAKMVADTLQLDWHVTTPGAGDFLEDIMQVCSVQEEPFISPSIFMQYYVMRLAHQHGLKVLLDGQGSDETLLGYSRYTAALASQFSGISRLRFFAQARKKYNLSYSNLLKGYFYLPHYQLRKMMAERKLKGLRPAIFGEMNEAYLRNLSLAYKDPLELQKIEITSSQIPALLRYEDRNSMYYSIETRLPFLDWELLEFNLSMPLDFKVKDGWSKYPIRNSMDKQLPDAITWRTNKFGFNSPDSIWLKDTATFKKWIEESHILNHFFDNPFAIAKLENGMLWKMVNIACWEKAFDVAI